MRCVYTASNLLLMLSPLVPADCSMQHMPLYQTFCQQWTRILRNLFTLHCFKFVAHAIIACAC